MTETFHVDAGAGLSQCRLHVPYVSWVQRVSDAVVWRASTTCDDDDVRLFDVDDSWRTRSAARWSILSHIGLRYTRWNTVLLTCLTLYSPEAFIVPHQITWSRYTGRWRVGCYIWYSEEETGRGPSSPRSLLAVPNVTPHPSTTSVPIAVLLYNGPLPCGFNVGIKG